MNRNFSLNSAVFFILFFLHSLLAGAQPKKGEFILLGTILENETLKLEGVTITAYEYKEKVAEATSSRKGYFEIRLQMNKDYTIEFSKPQYVTKSISLSTEPPNTCTVRQWEHDLGAVVSLFKHISGVNYSMYKGPFAYYEFKENCDFDKDETFAKTVSALHNKVRDEVTKAQKEGSKNPQAEIKMKEEQEKQKQLDEKYKQLVALADEEFNDKNYEGAQKIYTEALKIKPGQIYPETQLTMILARIADREKAKEQEAKAKEKEAGAVAEKKEDQKTVKTEKKEELKKDEPEKKAPQPIQANVRVKEDLKKTEKKSEALLLRLIDDSPVNAELSREREIEKENDVKNIFAHTNAKRIFLEEIADSKMRMKQQISGTSR